MPIVQGSFTVGPDVGDDYATWAAAGNDIGTPLTGNLALTQTGDTTEVSAINKAAGIDLAGFTLLLDNASPHAGIVGAGHIINTPSLNHQIKVIGSSGIFEVRNLQFKHASGAGNQCLTLSSTPGGGITSKLHDLIFDGNGAAIPFEFFINHQFPNKSEVYNILHVDATSSLGFGCIRFDNNGDFSSANQFYNCIVNALGTGIGIFIADMTSGDHELYNLIAITAGTNSFNYAGSQASQIPERFMKNCASSDASAAGGTDAIISFVAATEFESLVKGNALFMVPNPTSQFAKGGTAVPTNLDMKGLAYYDSIPPIGGFRASSAPLAPSNGSVRGIPILRLTRRQARLMRIKNPRIFGV